MPTVPYDKGDSSATIKATADSDGDPIPHGVAATVVGGVATVVSTSAPMPVSDAGGSLTVDGTVAVSSSALPTGAATAAKQPALGTAGTPSADVLSVQGVSGGTAIPSSVLQPSASGTLTSVADTLTFTPPAGTTDVLIEFTVATSSSYNASTVVVEASTDGGTTWVADTSGVCLHGTGSIPRAGGLYTEYSGWIIQLLPGPGYATVVHKTGGRTIRCRMTGTAGALGVRMVAIATAGQVQDVNVLRPVANMTTRSDTRYLSSGAVVYRRVSTADTNLAVALSANRIYEVMGFNKHASNWAYLKLYIKSSTPVLASDTPAMTLALPPLWSGILYKSSLGAYGFGWAHAITGGSADTDTTAVGAGDVVIHLTY